MMEVQSNLHIVATHGTGQMWPLWRGGLFTKVSTLNMYVDGDRVKVAVMEEWLLYKGGQISRFDCTI